MHTNARPVFCRAFSAWIGKCLQHYNLSSKLDRITSNCSRDAKWSKTLAPPQRLSQRTIALKSKLHIKFRTRNCKEKHLHTQALCSVGFSWSANINISLNTHRVKHLKTFSCLYWGQLPTLINPNHTCQANSESVKLTETVGNSQTCVLTRWWRISWTFVLHMCHALHKNRAHLCMIHVLNQCFSLSPHPVNRALGDVICHVAMPCHGQKHQHNF